MEPRKLITSLGVILTTITGIILFFTEFDKIKVFFFPVGIAISVPLYVFSLLGIGLLVFYSVYIFYFKEVTSHKKTKTELENVKALLLDSERMRLIDFVTGIANQEKFKIDIQNRPKELFHLILIDLDGFGEINKKQGFQKGDEVIRTIAQELFGRMRRDEEIYKRDYKLENNFMKRIYRKYTGGDEFIFLIKGPQYEAVGFLSRIQKQLEELNAESPVFSNYKITFHGAIVPLYPSDTFEQAYDKLQRGFVQAAEESNGLRVYWDKTEEDTFVKYKSLYDNARRIFKIQ